VLAFSGRVAMVTGAGSGLGRVAALRLAAAGAEVAAVDIDKDGLQATAELGAGRIHVFPCDVTEATEVAAVTARAEDSLGPPDRLVHAAGIMPGGRILDRPVEALLAPMKVNYFGTVHVTRAVLPGMVERGRGDVVLFGSITGYSFTTSFAGYCASKAAVNAYGEILGHELRGSGLRHV